MNKKIRVEKWELKNSIYAMLLIGILNTSISIFFVYQLLGNSLSVGSYIALTTSIITLQGIFAQIGENLGSIFEAAIYNEALIRLLKMENSENQSKYSISEIQSIEIKNGTFRYPHTENYVFSNLNLKINKGEKVAIVGGNGSGKTTLVHCLIGLFELSEGELFINEKSLNNFEKESIYKNIAAVFQTFPKYLYTLRENIGFGNLEDMSDDDKLNNILVKVGLLAKFRETDVQFDTYLSKEIDGGVDLSGGEWQKIAIGRALVKMADLIVLDEPTASLDPHAELEILELFDNITRDKTTITITHRIGPTKLSDKIIVMEKGNIVECGSFTELMNNKQTFYKMYQAQSQWYE